VAVVSYGNKWMWNPTEETMPSVFDGLGPGFLGWTDLKTGERYDARAKSQKKPAETPDRTGLGCGRADEGMEQKARARTAPGPSTWWG
jgi:hypothetical protein